MHFDYQIVRYFSGYVTSPFTYQNTFFSSKFNIIYQVEICITETKYYIW